jgi:cytochrome c oxidase subunit 1
MFWLFGHPEVYILILPTMGIVSEILPTFARKPLFGYPFVVFSGVAIGLMGFGVWAHHMYTVGLGTVANAGFGISTILIAVPTGVKIFNWLATLWGGSINLKVPLYFAVGFISMFVIGGLTGVMHSMVPSDYQQQDSYFVVAHFHQVLFGGALFAIFGGIYYWFPKFTGRMLHEGLGKAHFWLMFLGFNLTFQPMMVLGVLGMPRRISTYPEGLGWDLWNMIATVGAFTIAASILFFMYNVFVSLRSKERAGADPWDGRTLEWTTPSPPPAYDFAEVPVVHARDDFWHRKYVENPEGVPVPAVAGGALSLSGDGEHAEATGHHGIHMPSPSFFPLLTSLGPPLIAAGLIYDAAIVAVGAVVVLVGVFGWALEPASE